ncbi:YidB family protein [Psychrobacter pygoscelis]|uniref:YidB family protein n=1 Tax=Psychrobacter pygoscelis TaxID=2488563 RepID=UPI001039FECE|nr:YidB family protein [Psychrobacter pygoscelis]
MSLLGNLITQVAKSAMDPEDSQRNPINQRLNPRRTGGLGDVLGSVLGGSNQGYNPQQYNRVDPNQLGLDDLLGGLMGGGGLGSVLGGGSQGSRGLGGMGTGGLGSILGSVLGGQHRRSGFGGKGMLVAALMPLVLSWIQRNGGLSGALGKLSSLGFGNQTQSWMSTQDANDNVDPNEIDKIFDHHEIMQIAQKTGADETEVRQGLAELLPEVVNQLTPNGDLATEQEANEEIEQIMGQLSGTLKDF